MKKVVPCKIAIEFKPAVPVQCQALATNIL